MSQRTSTEVPTFLKAKSPEGLRRKMLQQNAQMGVSNHYFDIQFVNGNWYAWFYFSDNKLFIAANNEKVPEKAS